MPEFSKHQSGERVRILVVGDSKAGKTSLIATLANAGYKTRIIDTDDGLDTLSHMLTEEGIANTHFVTLKDPLTKRAHAWKKAKDIMMMKGWKNDEEDLGNPAEWGPDTVLVVDSLTFLGEAAAHDALSVNGKNSYDQMTQQEWGEAVRQMKGLLNYIASDDFKCHIVMTALPINVEDDSGISKMYPSCVTKNFSMQVPRFFNNMVEVKERRDGSRYLRTTSTNRMSLGVADPSIEKEIDPDLGALFDRLTKKKAGKEK